LSKVELGENYPTAERNTVFRVISIGAETGGRGTCSPNNAVGGTQWGMSPPIYMGHV